ncbi:hypothetical protein [Pyxidicoccus sp. MSG2]|uniref:hypothetical protein n=1 Tax=Pyxidicoccus sp. MSG2 TaxID=2996790 RepID=UPI0022703613|nr:hypothetical protein [Pyxidicoccus sp. MSG2]MCY1021935.1 hypothetical protein [Pyxidicoccus sp. MSG2]
MNPRLLLAIAVWVCTACGGPSLYNVSNTGSDFHFSERLENGLIIISTRFISDCGSLDDRSVALQYVDDSYARKRMGTIPVSDPFREKDFQDPPGYLSIMEVIAGQHRIEQLSPYPYGVYAPFEVEAGKAIYLGEVHVRRSCHSDPKGLVIQVTDQWERDGKLFEQRMKNLRSEDVVKRVITGFSLDRPTWKATPAQSPSVTRTR